MSSVTIQWLEKDVDSVINELNERIKRLKKIRRKIAQSTDDTLRFKIWIRSSWHNEGEPNLEKDIYNGPLKEAIQQARKRFMKMNNRTDVQGDIFVEVYFDEDATYSLSKKDLWKLARAKNEQ